MLNESHGNDRLSATIEVDVSQAAGLDRKVHTTATVTFPDSNEWPQSPVVAFAVPGAGLNRHYFALDLPGTPGGQADWHVGRGWIFVALDALGVGEASLPDPELLNVQRLAATTHATVAEILRLLAAGEFDPRCPPVCDPVVLGLGHSMGGGLTIVQQAHHDTYDGVGILGFSAVGTTSRGLPGGKPIEMPFLSRDTLLDGPAPISHEARSGVAVNAALLRFQADPNHYPRSEQTPQAWQDHFDDVPIDLVEQDLCHDGLPAWRSSTMPAAVFWMLGPGALAPEAAAVIVPVLSAFGERDVGEDPRSEHKAFRHAVDFSSFICPRMGHMHNCASTREIFWSRIHHWGEHVADLKRRLPADWPMQLLSDSY